LQIRVEAGSHLVTITADGFATYERQLAVAAGDKQPLDVHLPRALGALPEDQPTKPRFGYVFGGWVGADVTGGGTLFLGDFGFRGQVFDLGVRAGTMDSLRAFDLYLRARLTQTRLAPFLGGGYTYLSGGFAVGASAGVRFDVIDEPRYGVSIMAESGYRYFSLGP